MEPTYTAASYWSPLDLRRHTVLYRRALGKDEDEKRLLAYAYAFYAVTFSGRHKNLFSATQYTAVHAERKRGVRVTYGEPEVEGTEGEPSDNWWHVPFSVHEDILVDTGLTEAVEACLLTDAVPAQSLRDMLRLMLLNEHNAPFELNGFPKRFFDEFPERALRVTERTREYAVITQTYVNNLFNAGLDEKQALFMLMTNLIYDQAFPSTYFYAFPVRFKGYCSVMTFGTKRALTALQYLCLTRIANSFFMHPLLFDYATEQSQALKSTSKMLLMSGFAHSANNALRMSDIDSLVTLLSSGTPPERANFNLEAGSLEEAVYGLRALWMGGRVAQSFIALIEMLTRPGHLRMKFTSERPYTIEECIAEAKKMVEVHVEGQGGDLPKLDAKCSSDRWVNARLPKGYLHYIYVYTFLYELLLNVCKYSPTKQRGGEYWADSLITTKFNEESLEVHILNMVDQKLGGR